MRSVLQPLNLLRRIRHQSALALMRRLHRITHRMPVALRPIQKSVVLVVAPHMDDDVIGAGGTLLLHRRLGSDTRVVFCAAGASPEIDAIRKAEARHAGDAMGFACLEWLDLPDGRLSLQEPAVGRQLSLRLQAHSPQMVFCPFVSDHHRDHAAVAQAVALAIRETGWSGDVWCYEVWSPLWPNVAVDISDVQALKREMIEVYASQTEGLHYADGVLGLNSYRGLKVNVRYAEAFYVCSASEFCALVDQMNRP